MNVAEAAKECKQCLLTKNVSDFTKVFVKNKWYLKTKCKKCTANLETLKRQENPERYKKHQEDFRRKSGMQIKKIFTTKEDQYRNKLANKYKYKKRIKHCRNLWDKELTDLVTKEAHDLRLRRNKITGINWHVDHIIPLNGKLVSGLHVWNNLRVIPARLNMEKGNRGC